MAKKAQSSKRPKRKKIMANRNRSSKVAQVFRSRQLKPLLFVLPFVIVAAVIMLFLSGASTPTAVPNAGIWAIWDNEPGKAATKRSFVKGGQVKVDWVDVQTGPGPNAADFNWSSLDAQANLFKNVINKPFTVQINSNKKPCSTNDPGCADSATDGINNTNRWWGYQSGNVKWCGLFGPNANPDKFDIPQFWSATAADHLNPDYKTYQSRLITSFAAKLGAAGYKSSILGVRTAPNLIGTEHHDFSATEDQISSVPSSLAGSACKRAGWDKDWGADAARAIMELYKTNFAGRGVKMIYRSNSNPDASNTTGMFFNTNANSDDTKRYTNDSVFYEKARDGTNIAYFEPFQKSEFFPRSVSWNWWTILQDLDKGVSYIAVYADDIRKAPEGPCPDNTMASTGIEGIEYKAAFCFANKYAPFANNQGNAAKAAATPGAWVVFTQRNLSYQNTGYMSMYATASVGTGGAETAENGASLDVGGQRYGRYSRSTSPGKNLTMILKPNFKGSLSTNIKINVVYYDNGNIWSLNCGLSCSKTPPAGTAPTNKWKSATFVLSPTESNALKSFGTITLSSNNPTAFHMLEVLR